MLCTLPLHAIGCSLGTVVGQNLGAGRPDRAEKAGWQANTASLLIEIPTCILMFIFAEAIAAKMSNDAQVVKLTADYLRIVGLCQPLVASWIVLFGAMTGAGYTKWPMWVGIFCLTVVRLPLAYILVSQYKMGAQGIWVALAASASLVGIMAILRFRSGAWKNQDV
jgi:Na+-driven multidrug efflux pump